MSIGFGRGLLRLGLSSPPKSPSAPGSTSTYGTTSQSAAASSSSSSQGAAAKSPNENSNPNSPPGKSKGVMSPRLYMPPPCRGPESQQFSSGSEEGKAEESSSVEDRCLCERPSCNVLCISCGYTFKGRARRMCPLHTGVIHLMDADACPECYSSNLKECSTAR